MNSSYRIVMGERLKQFREELAITIEQAAMDGGITPEEVRVVEAGDGNYSIDTFIGYIQGCNLYLYFADKDPAIEGHDFDDLAKKGCDNLPK